MGTKNNPEEQHKMFMNLISNDQQLNYWNNKKLQERNNSFKMRINLDAGFEMILSDRDLEIDKNIEARMIEIRDYRAPINPIYDKSPERTTKED